jgi:hypothetical protein
LKFLLAKADDLTDQNGIDLLVNNLIDLLAVALAGGETFLPGTTDYDDLFYKLVQATTQLEQFSTTCMCPPHPTFTKLRFWETAFSGHDDFSKCMQTLPSSFVGTSKGFQVTTFVIGGSYKGD